MGGGHKKKNPHGSPTGKKGRGDDLAEKIHGRKGMYKDSREKGPSHIRLITKESKKQLSLSDDEFQIIWMLFNKNKYDQSFLLWEDLLIESEVIGITEEDKVVKLMQNLNKKVEHWLNYYPCFRVSLKREYHNQIRKYLIKYYKSYVITRVK